MIETEALSEPASQFVEKMGVVLGDEGMPKIAARVFALLLVSPRDLSLDEIATTLGVSKASVSLETRRLEQRGILERVSRPGDRRDYYVMRESLIAGLFEQRLRRWRRVHEVVTEARGTLATSSEVVDSRLAELAQGLAESIRSLSTALDRWRSSDVASATRKSAR